MKNFLTLLFLLPAICFSQTNKITGIVKNSKNQTIEFANIVLQNQADSLKVHSEMTNKAGVFEIKNLSNGDYTLKVSIVGFDDYSEIINLYGDISKQIVLKESTVVLTEVMVSNRRPTIKRKSDRLEYIVQNTIASSGNAWEIIKKTPGVLVSGNTIAVRGSRAVLVTINDKKTYLSGDDLKNLLQGMGGADIKSVEVITNPSAKYDASGSSVLNIKLINNTSLGYKGSVGTNYSQGVYADNAFFTRHYYKTKAVALMAGYLFAKENHLFQGENVVYYNNTQATWKSDVFRKMEVPARHNFQANVGFMIDSLNTITVGTNILNSPNNKGDNTIPTNIYDSQNQLQSYFSTNSKQSFPIKSNSYFFNYDHRFRKNGTITFASDYATNEATVDENVTLISSFGPSFGYNFLNNNYQNIKIFSGQVDYILEKEKSSFEAGLKTSNIRANNVLDFQNITGVVLGGSSSNFDYKETVLAGYVSYSKELEKWSLKAGLRTESTINNGISTNPKDEKDNKYTHFFPTVNALYKISEGNSVGFSYGKRIQRPNYKWLNPSKSFYNPYSYFTGDSGMKPTIIDNFGVSYTRKDKYFFDLYYKNEKDPVVQISKQDNISTPQQIAYQYTNIEKSEAFGLDFSTELEPKPWWSMALQAGAGYNNNVFVGTDKSIYKNNIFVYNASINQVFYINETKGFTAEMNFKYNSPTVKGSYNVKQISSLEIGFKKTVLQNKGILSLKVSDIYKGEIEAESARYANQNNYYNEYVDSQRVTLDFRYKFGNQKIRPNKDKEKTEEQKRLDI